MGFLCTMAMEVEPLVSVIVPAYQHEAYIAACLDGILGQQVSFPMEILIGEDESTDGTRAICQRYAELYPERIKLFLRSRRDVVSIMGRPTGRANLMALLASARGKYIAMCEGDDYWTDPLKLQKQVDRLEADPRIVLSFHAVRVLKPDGTFEADGITRVPELHRTRMDLATRGNYIHTPTVVYRRVLGEFPPEIFETPIADFFIYMLLSAHGELDYVPDVMAVYRGGVGIWSSRSRYQRNLATAVCHGALVEYYARTQEPEMVEVFKGRVRTFLERYEAELEPEGLSHLLRMQGGVQHVVTEALLERARRPVAPASPSNPSVRRILERLRSRFRG